jgi:High potential iron-sulfur protein
LIHINRSVIICAFTLLFEHEEADMSAILGAPSRAFSRRIVLLQSAGCAAGAAAGLILATRQAAAKMSQPSVAYQDTPKGDQECSNCSLFQEPDACTLVDGKISPAGWCKFWVKKPG